MLQINQKDKSNLIEKLQEENPVLLDGLTNVWCISVDIKENSELATINIILTHSL